MESTQKAAGSWRKRALLGLSVPLNLSKLWVELRGSEKFTLVQGLAEELALSKGQQPAFLPDFQQTASSFLLFWWLEAEAEAVLSPLFPLACCLLLSWCSWCSKSVERIHWSVILSYLIDFCTPFTPSLRTHIPCSCAHSLLNQCITFYF